MENMRNKTNILFIIIVLFGLNVNGQSIDYLDEFNKVLNSNYSTGYSEKRINAKSKSGNAIFFLETNYFINANNIQGNKEVSRKIIQNIIDSSSIDAENRYTWLVTDVSPENKNFSQKGKEFLLYEGYVFRYIAEFQYRYPEATLSDKHFVKKVFFKWKKRSSMNHGDMSSLYGVRFHIGSHWATVATYLTKTDSENKELYQSFIDEYDKQLKKSLKVVKIDGAECYVWNSTYQEKYTNLLNRRSNEDYIIQDVSHGNHIVQYVIDSYNLGSDVWKKKDLERFANTLKYIIWKDKNKPADRVDGSFSNAMGWKQSDGWMKLMVILNDKELFEIYDSFYKNNSNKVDKFYPNLQYFANMAIYQKNNKEL